MLTPRNARDERDRIRIQPCSQPSNLPEIEPERPQRRSERSGSQRQHRPALRVGRQVVERAVSDGRLLELRQDDARGLSATSPLHVWPIHCQGVRYLVTTPTALARPSPDRTERNRCRG